MPTLDITKASIDILMDKINAANNTSLNSADFTFSNPTPFSQVGKTENTQIILTANIDSDYYGIKTCIYSRMNLSDILDNPNIEILYTNETTLAQLIPKINHFFGINLTSDDYFDQPLDPYLPDIENSVVIVAKENSYLFQGSYRLIIGPKVPVNEVGTLMSSYYAVINGLNATAGILSTIKSFKADGSIDTNFVLCRNASAITHFEIRKIYYYYGTTIIVDGEFSYTASIDDPGVSVTVPEQYVSKTLWLHPDGTIIQQSPDRVFGGAAAALVAQVNSSLVFSSPYNTYVVDSGTSLGSNPNKLYRYGFQDGIIDPTYTATGLGHVPSVVSITDDGKVYTATSIIVAPIPSNNDIPGKQIRIDRLTIDGSADTAFTPVIITAPGNGDPLNVVQIVPINNDGFWLLLNPIYGTSITQNLPIINGVPTIVNPGNTDYSFNPIYRFNENGTWRTSFSNALPHHLPLSIYNVTGSNLAINDKVLVARPDRITFFTNKTNPITGYLYRMPISFNTLGKGLYVSGSSYEAQYRWTAGKHIVPTKEGKYISYGFAKLFNPDGTWDDEKQIIVRYKVDGTPDDVFYTHVPNLGNTNEVITQVLVTEFLLE